MRILLTLLLSIALSSCLFENRLIESPRTKIDRDLLGTWESQRKPKTGKMRVMKVDKYNYFVTTPGLFGIAVEKTIGGKRIFQWESLEPQSGRGKPLAKFLHYLKIELEGEKLTIHLMNLDYFRADGPIDISAKELRKLLSINQEPVGLFGPPETFIKTEDSEIEELVKFGNLFLQLLNKSREGTALTDEEFNDSLEDYAEEIDYWKLVRN